VHELNAHGVGVDFSGSFSRGAVQRLKFGMLHPREMAERIKIGLEVSPTAKIIEHAIALGLIYINVGGRKSVYLQ
jgi:hypothetical protein